MKKVSYFLIALLTSGIMLFACDGQQSNRNDQGRETEGMYEEDRGLNQDDQDRQMQDDPMQDDTLGTGSDTTSLQQN